MTDFQRDLEVLINEGVIAPNGKQIRFVFKYGNRFKGELELLGLNDRSYNCLRRNKINDISEISERWNELKKLRNAGTKTIKEVKNKYIAYYYDTLSDEEKKEFWIDTITATANMK